jgi:hypothetical protein
LFINKFGHGELGSANQKFYPLFEQEEGKSTNKNFFDALHTN